MIVKSGRKIIAENAIATNLNKFRLYLEKTSNTSDVSFMTRPDSNLSNRELVLLNSDPSYPSWDNGNLYLTFVGTITGGYIYYIEAVSTDFNNNDGTISFKTDITYYTKSSSTYTPVEENATYDSETTYYKKVNTTGIYAAVVLTYTDGGVETLFSRATFKETSITDGATYKLTYKIYL